MMPLEMFRTAGKLSRANQHAFLEWYAGLAGIERECLDAVVMATICNRGSGKGYRNEVKYVKVPEELCDA